MRTHYNFESNIDQESKEVALSVMQMNETYVITHDESALYGGSERHIARLMDSSLKRLEPFVKIEQAPGPNPCEGDRLTATISLPYVYDVQLQNLKEANAHYKAMDRLHRRAVRILDERVLKMEVVLSVTWWKYPYLMLFRSDMYETILKVKKSI